MELKIIETVVAVAAYFIIRVVLSGYIDRTVQRSVMQKSRGKIIKKGINFILFTITLVVLFVVWGINQSELAVFIGSFLAILGVALFAQWSILSNITSGIIIFFNHPVKLDEMICIMDKDFEIEGRVSDIGLFFVILKTKEGEQITIPSNVFVQKMIKKQK